jgi:AcrR family transcriptional regulator
VSSPSPAPGRVRLRADAQRNAEEIRQAALQVFREHGLGTALEEVARAAGVSKGTIYHRFGGRTGLIDAVVEDLVAEHIDGVLTAVELIEDPVERFEVYLRTIWLLQFDEPAANDVLLRAQPESRLLLSLCERARAFAGQLLTAAQATGDIRDDFTADDVYSLIWERGVVARAFDKQFRQDYERRLDFVLHGLRAGSRKIGLS